MSENNSPRSSSSQSLLGNQKNDGSPHENTGYSMQKSALRNRLTLAHFKHSYSLRSLFTVKPIEAFLESRDAKPDGGSLAEKLELIDLLGYGVGCTVGAGIYSLIGIGAGIAG